MSIKIRKVQQSDAAQYIELINYVWRIAYSHIFPEKVFLERENSTTERINNFDASKLNNDETVCYVAEDNGKIVAAMLGTINSDYSYFKEKGYADLCVLYILPEYQGKGIASQLKNIFIEYIKSKDYNKYVIGVLEDNLKARTIYEKWGGKLEEYSSFVEKCNQKFSEVFYTYDLSKQGY